MRLPLDAIKDKDTRDAFQALQEQIGRYAFLKGNFRHVELSFIAAVTNFRYAHRLGFVPRDVIQTAKTGSGAVTWNHDSFDKDTVSITTTGPCVVRAFIGSYSEG